MSGHHENIQNWRKQQSLIVTKQHRPELLGNSEGRSIPSKSKELKK
jgi:tRNA G37 N-methylase TrmD